MRKILVSLALLTIFAAPSAALAATDDLQECCTLRKNITVGSEAFNKGAIVGPTGGACATAINQVTVNWGMFCILNTMNGIIDWTFTVLVILAVFFTILGAWTIITAGGKAENVTKGKDFILYAAIGLAVGFLAKALPGIVRSIAGF